MVFPPWYQTNGGQFVGVWHSYVRKPMLPFAQRHSTRVHFCWPVYILEVLGSAVVVVFVIKKMDRQNRKGYCDECGYCLYGTIDAGRNVCPECGCAFECRGLDGGKVDES